MEVQENKHIIFLVCGRTAAGKDSLVSKVCEELSLNQLKSYATRPKRQGEGNTHIFISESEIYNYDNKIAYTNIDNNHYFATKEQLYNSDLYIIDPRGISWMREKSCVDLTEFKFVTIMITAPYNIRKQRAIVRNDNIDVFESRNIDECSQFDSALLNEDFDYVISNNNFENAYKVFESIINIERCGIND